MEVCRQEPCVHRGVSSGYGVYGELTMNMYPEHTPLSASRFFLLGDRGMLDQALDALAHGVAGAWILVVVGKLELAGNCRPLLPLPIESECMVRLLGIDTRWTCGDRLRVVRWRASTGLGRAHGIKIARQFHQLLARRLLQSGVVVIACPGHRVSWEELSRFSRLGGPFTREPQAFRYLWRNSVR